MERERDREDTKSNMLDELWVEEGEPGKLILKGKLYHFYLWIAITLPQGHVYQQLGHVQHLHLVKVHHEELVRGCQLRALAGKLSVKVRDVFSMPLGMKIILNQIHSVAENPHNRNGWYIHVDDDCHAIFSTVYIEIRLLIKTKNNRK